MGVCGIKKWRNNKRRIRKRRKIPQNSFTILLHLKIHVREVESDIKTKISHKQTQGYYTQGDEKIESNYNHSEEEKDSIKTRELLLLRRWLLFFRCLPVRRCLLFRISLPFIIRGLHCLSTGYRRHCTQKYQYKSKNEWKPTHFAVPVSP